MVFVFIQTVSERWFIILSLKIRMYATVQR